MSFWNIVMLIKDCCHSKKVFFSLSFSNSFLSNSNSFLLNSKIAEQQRSRCRGYYENWKPQILPVDRVLYIRPRVLQKRLNMVWKTPLRGMICCMYHILYAIAVHYEVCSGQSKIIVPPPSTSPRREQLSWTLRKFSHTKRMSFWNIIRIVVIVRRYFFSFFLKFILVKFKFIPAEFKNCWAATVQMQRVLWNLEAKNSACGQGIIHQTKGTTKKAKWGTKKQCLWTYRDLP